jgi:formylglycine-generating enzyme required for sulfatase activity
MNIYVSEGRKMKKTLWVVLSCSVLIALPVFAVCPSADLTGDCYVDLADFAEFVNQWLTGIPKDLVSIPAGTFQMGDSFNEGGTGERPVHT